MNSGCRMSGVGHRQKARTSLFLALCALCGGCLGRVATQPLVPAPQALNAMDNVMPRHWLTVGPFVSEPDAGSEGAASARFPQAFVNAETFSAGMADVPSVASDSAHVRPVARRGDVVDLDRILGGEGPRVGYAIADVVVPEETVVQLLFAATGASRAWVNGRPVFRTPNRNGTFCNRDGIFAARLQRGTNRLMLEVGSGPRGWAFSLTPADPFQTWLYRRSDYRRGNLTLTLKTSDDPAVPVVKAVPPRWLKAERSGPAEIVAWNLAGQEKFRASFDMDKGFPLPLPKPGLYRARVFQPYADNSERVGTLWLAHGDLAERVRAARTRADRWLAGPGGEDSRHRGRLLWLLETALAPETSDEPPRIADAYEFAALESLLDELESGRDALGARRGTFLWAFPSGTDGSGQPISISLPDDFDPATPVPLAVYLHGSGGRWTGEAFRSAPFEEPYIQISGDWRGGFMARSYHGLAERDILDAIAFMRENFRIAPDRVVLFGHSYGGFAAWRLGSLYPDRFAALASHAGLPEGYPFANLRHTPIRSYHGLKDLGVCPVFAYYGARETRRAGGESDVIAFPDAGHWARGAHGDAVRWLLTQRADPLPRTVEFTTRWVSRERGRAYWTEILELSDPQRPARLRLNTQADRLTGSADNIARLKLRSLPGLFVADQPLHIEINGHEMRLDAPLPERIAMQFGPDGTWTWLALDQARPAEPVYSMGSLQNLFDGRPVRVVIPSEAPVEYREAVSRGAHRLAQTRRRYGGLPVVTDRDIDPDAPDAHLVVFGAPANNAVMKRLLELLPLDDNGARLAVPVLGSYELAGRGYAYYYHHPLQPEYRVVLYRSDEPGFFRDPFAILPDGRYRPNKGPSLDAAPDFALFDVAERRFLRVACLGKDWSFPAAYAESAPLDPRLSERQALYSLLGEALRAATGADYAYTPFDEEPRVNPATMRTADLATLARAVWGVGIVDLATVEFDNETMRFVADRLDRKDLIGRAFDPYALWPRPQTPWSRDEGVYTVALMANRFQDFGTVTRMRWARGPDLLDGVRTVSGERLELDFEGENSVHTVE